MSIADGKTTVDVTVQYNKLTGTTSELFADDAAIATWAKANVYACKAAGVFNGDDNNNFNPTSTLTRAEAASIMVNAMK